MSFDVAARADQLLQAFTTKKHRLLIGGKWVDAVSGETFDVWNPATGSVIARAAAGDRADVDLAVKAARAAFEGQSWGRMPPSERAKLLWRLADLVEAAADELALVETLDNGKPFKAARAFDITGCVDRLRYYAGWATKLSGDTLEVSSPRQHLAYTIREPVGVVGLIVPWNAPLMMAVTKVAPALAAGCSVILKPAEQTPLSALRFGELVQEAGFPDGVVNIVTGFGHTAGAAIVDHPGVDKVSFTGSTEVGKEILRGATGNLKRVTLELGGKSPVIVFPDAHVPSAVEGVARGIFFNTGQVCSAGSRLFVHESIFEELVDGVAAAGRKLRVGPGTEPTTDLGPVVSDTQLDRVQGYIRAGREAGAQVRSGGAVPAGPGYFIEPTILIGTTPDMAVRREEIFGPVLCAMSFSDGELDAIAAEANDTTYGLAAHVYTRDLATAHKIARRLKVGSVRINGGGMDANVPGGGFKQSGWGRENGKEGIEAYTELKSVVIALE